MEATSTVKEVAVSSLVKAGTAESRFLEAADVEGNGNGLVSVDEIQNHTGKHPEQADLIGREVIASWVDRITRFGEAKPRAWIARCNTAPLGQNAFEQAQELAGLLRGAGMKVTDIRETVHIGTGKCVGAEVDYQTPPVNDQILAAVQTRGVSTSFFSGGCIQMAAERVDVLRSCDNVILNVRITSTFGTGKIASIAIDFMPRATYEKLGGPCA